MLGWGPVEVTLQEKGGVSWYPATFWGHSLQAFHLLCVPPPFSRSLVPTGASHLWVCGGGVGGPLISWGLRPLQRWAQGWGGWSVQGYSEGRWQDWDSHQASWAPAGATFPAPESPSPYFTRLVRELQHTPPWQVKGRGHPGGWQSWGTGPQRVAQLEWGGSHHGLSGMAVGVLLLLLLLLVNFVIFCLPILEPDLHVTFSKPPLAASSDFPWMAM